MLFWALILAMSVAVVVAILAPLRHAFAADARKSVSRVLAFAAVCAAPLLAAFIYSNIGAPESLSAGFEMQAAAPSPADAASIAALSAEERGAVIENMVAGLQARLRDQPDDIEGWRMLARSYGVLNRPQGVALAYREITARDPAVSAQDWQVFAGALLEARPDGDETVSGEVFAVLTKLQSIRDDHPLALFYLGFAARDRGEPEKALGLWRRLLEQMPADASFRPTVENLIATAGAPEVPSDIPPEIPVATDP